MKRSIYSISRLDQIRALASPVRVEIVDLLASLPDSPVAAIAAALGRPADSLYYHLRELVRVGLARPVGRRRGRHREETLYRTVAPRLSAAYDPSSPANVAGWSRTVSGLLRLGARDFRRALSSGEAAVSGPRRELWAGRLTGRLSGPEVARINRLLHGILEILESSRTRSKGRLFAVSFLLVPLDRRPRGRRKALPDSKRRLPAREKGDET